MGRFLGHSSTGTYFYVLGMFFFLRSQNLRLTQKLRTHWAGCSFVAFSMLAGGIIYTIGEISTMIIQIGSWQMSTTQHVIMSTSFSLCGLISLLHIWRLVKNVGLVLMEPLLWFLLFVLWYFHPQDNQYFSFGHISIGVMFCFVSLGRLAELFIATFSNSKHHRAVHFHQARLARQPVTSWRDYLSDERINSIYNNLNVFGTPLPFFNGFLLQLIGTWDWDMAVHFKDDDMHEPESGMEDHEHSLFMIAEETWIIHLLVNLVVCILITALLPFIDRRVYGPEPVENLKNQDQLRFHLIDDNTKESRYAETESTRELVDSSSSAHADMYALDSPPLDDDDDDDIAPTSSIQV